MVIILLSINKKEHRSIIKTLRGKILSTTNTFILIMPTPIFGQGKGGKGLVKGGAKRHRKVIRDNIEGISRI